MRINWSARQKKKKKKNLNLNLKKKVSKETAGREKWGSEDDRPRERSNFPRRVRYYAAPVAEATRTALLWFRC
jgi:hypothetical protein